MRVKAENVDYGKLAGGILATVNRDGIVDVDAVGETAVSNAVKAMALADAFAEKDGLAGLAFAPLMVQEDAEDGQQRRFLRFAVSRRPAWATGTAIAPDFSHGGIAVPSASGAVAAELSPNGRPQTLLTPSELSRTVLGEWLRYAAPKLRYDLRPKQENGKVELGRGGRRNAPFLVSLGPSALSRATKAIAFARSDINKAEHLAGAPSFLVVPRLWTKKGKDKYGAEKESKVTVLCLVREVEEQK